MQFQFGITPPTPAVPLPPPTPESIPDLLRQILEVQREQLAQMLAVQKEHLDHVRAVRQEPMGRSHYILSHWGQEYPEFAEHCRKAFPIMERAYIHLLVSMVEDLAQREEGLENEFSIQEFVDRYGMKVGQLQHLLGIVGPLAEAAKQIDEQNKQQQQQPQQG